MSCPLAPSRQPSLVSQAGKRSWGDFWRTGVTEWAEEGVPAVWRAQQPLPLAHAPLRGGRRVHIQEGGCETWFPHPGCGEGKLAKYRRWLLPCRRSGLAHLKAPPLFPGSFSGWGAPEPLVRSCRAEIQPRGSHPQR